MAQPNRLLTTEGLMFMVLCHCVCGEKWRERAKWWWLSECYACGEVPICFSFDGVELRDAA